AVVHTSVVCQPTLSIPLFGVSVPGLNAPMAFSVSSESTMENPDNAPISMNGQNGQSGQNSQNQNAKIAGSGQGAAAGSQVNALAKPLPRGGWDGNNLRIAVHRCCLLGSGGK
ncbi:hypothetical protein KBF38_01690, partial [bacterium]|nr:hypothetical protein [bacterium]